jgi:hypothetical protein
MDIRTNKRATFLLCVTVAFLFSLFSFPQRGSAADASTLRETLLSYEWSLVPQPAAWGYLTKVIFHPDGTATVVGYSFKAQAVKEYTWAWKVLGDRKIQLGHLDKPAEHICTFDRDLTTFVPSNWPNQSAHRAQPITAGQPAQSTGVVAATNSNVTVYKPDDSKLRILKEQAPNVQAWITSPLYQWVPEDIYQNMAHLQQDLLDEKEDRVRQTPALADAYAFASGLCAQFKLAIEARKAAVVASGGPNPPLTSQLTNWRRDNLTWPMWAEERDERRERQGWVKKHQDQMNQWTGVAAKWATKLDLFYVDFRQHYRESLHEK